MGYYTDYEIRVLDSDLPIHTIELIIDQYCDNLFEDGKEDDVFYAYTVKWYEHESDFAKLSKEGLPDTIIEVMGYGEEKGDVWRKFFHNGKVQRCETVIAFDPYDSSKLEEPREI